MGIRRSTASAINRYCARLCGPGGFLGIPPAHGRGVKLALGNASHDNDLAYSLVAPKSCLDDGVHRPSPYSLASVSCSTDVPNE